jgi:hypothetical protein
VGGAQGGPGGYAARQRIEELAEGLHLLGTESAAETVNGLEQAGDGSR